RCLYSEHAKALAAESEYRHRAETRPEALGQYSDISYLSKSVVRLLVLQAVAGAVLAFLAGSYYSTLIGLTEYGYQAGAAQAANDRVSVTAIIYVGLYIACGVMFVVWTYRAYRNLGALGASQKRYRNGWAIGGWFVPIL